jgi:hypothetical protein
VLVYVAASHEPNPPEFVLSAIAIREADEKAVRDAIGETNAEVLRDLLKADRVKAIVAIARDSSLAVDAPPSRCFFGLYLRLRLLLEAGQQRIVGRSSLFFRAPPDLVRDAQLGLEEAAARFGEQKLVFTAPDSPGSPGRVATQIADLIAATYSGGALPEFLTKTIGEPQKPFGWIHYTLETDCPCLACRSVRLATDLRPAPTGKPGGSLPHGIPIGNVGLPPKVADSLRAAGIRTLTQVDLRKDSELLRIRNVGLGEVELLRETVARYRVKR